MRKNPGESRTRLYKAWLDMRRRCNNPNRHEYRYYGGRGIRVCDAWENDFQAFKSWSYDHGYDDDMSIERIDVDGNYTPDNCIWIPFLKQASNKTTSFKITYNNETHTLAEWSRITGIHENTLTHRIRDLGWSIEDSLELKSKGKLKRYPIDGEMLTISEMSARYNKPLKTIWSRINRLGWDAKRAVCR